VSFQLPESQAGDQVKSEEDEARGSKLAALAHSLKRLTLAAGAATAAAASRPSKPEKRQKRILRQPVLHVYLRGASGLPTQRVPLSAVSHRGYRHTSMS